MSASPRRFTLDGSPDLESRLAATCRHIGAGVSGLIPGPRLEGLVLGGGYGRGEGGVWRRPDGDRPYNDLEFYVFVRGSRLLNEQRYGRALHCLGEILTPQAGVEVEFKLVSLAGFTAGPVSLFSHDLVRGHRVILGRPDLLAGCRAHHRGRDVPASEGTRLLFNRATGLLLARARLQRPAFTPADADFVARNLAKVELALGDAVLLAHGLHHWSVRRRHDRLVRLADSLGSSLPFNLVASHAAGLAFKLHPFRSEASREELAARHAAVTAAAAVVWAWLEGRRLGRPVPTPADYASLPGPLWPVAPRLRTLLVNLRVRGWRLGPVAAWFRHPREPALRALALLLWGRAGDAATLRRIQRVLGTPARDLSSLVAAYLRLWSRVS